MNKKNFLRLMSVVLIWLATFSYIAYANHSWGNYHWERPSNPLNLAVGDNVSAEWDSHLAVAVSDWNQSSVINLTVVPGQARGQCRPTAGRIEVCNDFYGNNGWLGIAQIWISGNHITQATSKMNDTYFSTPQYNTSAWRQLVMCQEIAHDFGLGHQDENFDDPPMGTCMDYTSDPVPNQHPDQHDYQQLEEIYAHLDGSGGGCTHPNPRKCPGADAGNNGVAGEFNHPSEWGQLVRSHGRTAIYERNFGNQRMITFVIWAN